MGLLERGDGMIERIRYWFFETFAVRHIERTYLGHGDFTEECGWICRGKFCPLDRAKEQA